MVELLASWGRGLREWLFNRAGSSVGEVDAVQLSVLRVVLLGSLLLGGALGLHGVMMGALQGRWAAVMIALGVLLLLLLAARLAGATPRRGAALLVAAIYLASIAILVSTGWSSSLSSLGYVFSYAAPMVAGLLLSLRLALALMLLNTLGFVLGLSGWMWPQLPPQWVHLPDAGFYIQAAVFSFFNLALPLAVFRLSVGMRAAHGRLQQSLRLSEDVFQAASAPTLVCDPGDRVLRANEPFLRLLGGMPENALQGRRIDTLLRPEALLEGPAQAGGWQPLPGRRWLLGEGSARRAVVLRSGRHTAGGDRVYSFEDMTRLLRVQSDLAESMRRERQASRADPVTGLPNRARCCRLLDHLQRREARRRQRGLLTVRISNLRQLNARFGVDGGDQALRSFVQVLQDLLPKGSVAARVRASVIAVLLPVTRGEAELMELVQALRDGLPTQTWIGGHLAKLDLSFGLVCIGQEEGVDPTSAPAPVDGAEWLRRSELALDLVDDPRWRSRFDGVGMFNAQTAAQVNRAMAIEAALPHALGHGELHLVYQPKFGPELDLLGFEALARWRCARLGEVSPMDFIPAAEASGQIAQLSDWALDSACAQMARWREAGCATTLSVAVNLSAQDLERSDLCECVLAAVRRHGLGPDALQLEVTESVLAQREDAALEQLRRLREAGFRVAVDDFGTGYSSLAKIVDMPLDAIKIDRSFLRDCPGDARRERVVRSIVMLAHTLKLEVIAEGVETPQQQDFLNALGVQGVQGYLLGRPQAAGHWESLVQAGRLQAADAGIVRA